eukprot:TRINITY_DN59590_c0_g2_i1.p1 TRINITY_DN59590_c0_g2~~TRINITY_DN59590_c0_g2_i1.p1  ORF type:complete len:637 (+),score=55.78 TRINITY_DN59590_c0_g2_i1:73-1911(+)
MAQYGASDSEYTSAGKQEITSALHVTCYDSWNRIKTEGLQRRQGRQHIHLFNPPTQELTKFDWGAHGVTEQVEVVIYVDMNKARDARITFYPHRKVAGVVLTRGINGTLPAQFFAKAIDVASGNVIWTPEQEKQQKETPPSTPTTTQPTEKSVDTPDYKQPTQPAIKADQIGVLVHGTDIRALQYIESEGIHTGLRKDGTRRVHIHCARAPKDNSEMPELRRAPNSEVFVYIDGAAMQKDGIPFFTHLKDPDTIVTPGQQGIIPPKYFVKIVPKTEFTLPPLLCAKLITFKDIPVIDLSKPPSQVALELSKVCQEVGFFQIVNHGIPLSWMDRILEQAKLFFSLPKEKKNKAKMIGARGHFEMEAENLNLEGDPTKKPDLKEGFDVGREQDTPQHPAFGINQWPDSEDVPEFRKTLTEYYGMLENLGRRMMTLFALSLRLSPTYFDEMVTNPVCTLRLLHYPPGIVKQLGAGAHKDYGCCTLLLQDDAGGLQAQNAAGEWVYVRPIKGAYVVNLGEMTERWTNQRFGATIHRVFNTSNRERYSSPFFFNPNLDTMIEPLPNMTDPKPGTVPPKPDTCENILAQRYAQTFKHHEKGGCCGSGQAPPEKRQKAA